MILFLFIQGIIIYIIIGFFIFRLSCKLLDENYKDTYEYNPEACIFLMLIWPIILIIILISVPFIILKKIFDGVIE